MIKRKKGGKMPKKKVRCSYCYQEFEIDPEKESLPRHQVPKSKAACTGTDTKQFKEIATSKKPRQVQQNQITI